MKISLFIHEQDIDGLGSPCLAREAKLKYDLILCKTLVLKLIK